MSGRRVFLSLIRFVEIKGLHQLLIMDSSLSKGVYV